MRYTGIGDSLLTLANQARDSATLVAPYIKVRALSRVLDALRHGVRLRVFTRWLVEDLAAGASDLDAWELVRSRRNSTLHLVPHLHAKYYRFDATTMAGSANLTLRGFGWAQQSNLEVLHPVTSDEDCRSFEAALNQMAIEVDESLYLAMLQATQELSTRMTSVAPMGDGPDPVRTDSGQGPMWLPELLQARRLFDCYSESADVVIASVYASGRRDLEALRVPSGLSSSSFRSFVAARLLEHPTISALDQAARVPISRQAGAQMLQGVNSDGTLSPIDTWDALCAWLVEFLPSRFRIKWTVDGPALERSQILLSIE